MAPKTPRLRLNNPGVNDPFSVTDLSENWSLLDAHPGVYICTSSTRPTWGEDQDGQLIYETDSSLYWYWKWSGVSGSFTRLAPAGLLGRTVYTSANVNNSAAASPTTITSVTVTPKEGGRSVRIDAGWYAINSNGVAGIIALYREATVLASYRCQPGAGGALTFYEVPPSTSSTTYSIQLLTTADGTNSQLVVSATFPAFISVAEV